MYRERGYLLDFDKVIAAEDFEFLKAYNQFIEACYTQQRTLDRKTKELIFGGSDGVTGECRANQASHQECAGLWSQQTGSPGGIRDMHSCC